MKQSEQSSENFDSEDLNGIVQPTKEEIKLLAENLMLPFNKKIAMALIYGDNHLLPERILPEWLKELE